MTERNELLWGGKQMDQVSKKKKWKSFFELCIQPASTGANAQYSKVFAEVLFLKYYINTQS